MDNISIIWLIVLLGAGAACLWLKDKQKKIATFAFLMLMTVYVGTKFYQSIYVEKKIGKAAPSIDVDRAELMLRITSAVESFRTTAVDSVKALPGGAVAVGNQKLQEKIQDNYAEPEKILKSAAESTPESVSGWAKLALVEHLHKEDPTATLERLVKLNTPESLALEKAMKTTLKGPVSRGQVSELKREIEHQMPAGWYRSHALETLYTRAGDKTDLDRLLNESASSEAVLFAKIIFLTIVGAVSLLVGVVIIFVQLLFVARNSGKIDEGDLVKSPVLTSAATIYGVFIGWLATQSMIGSIAQTALKSISPLLKMSAGMEPGSNKPVIIALTVACLYLLSNGPGTLYAYLFTMRPHKIAFFEGFRMRARVGKIGPVRLVLAGLGTWFVAVPLVLVASLIGSKLGSQGSTNPIIALIMEAARSGNLLSTVLFYLTLGVLAPLCEETLFRGFLYSNLRRSMGVFPAMCISAFLFAGFHLDMGAFFPLFTLGCLFALVFEKTKSILPSMVAHGLWNSGTFTLLLLLFGS